MTFGEAGGFVTVTETSTPIPVPPGERLHRALRELDHNQSEEAKRRAAERQEVQDEIDRIAGERAALLEQVEKLKQRAATMAAALKPLRARLANVPDEQTERAQRHRDRLAALERALKAEVHMVDAMVDAWAAYASDLERWADEVRSRPDFPEHSELIEFAATSPEAIDGLDPVLRKIVEQRLASARETIETLPKPQTPDDLAPVYECVTPLAGGGAVAAIVIPAGPGSLNEGHRHARFVASVVAAACQALIELTDADAPVLLTDVCEHGVVVGSVCSTDALDADLFGVRVQEQLSDLDDLAVGVHPIDDLDLERALADEITKAVENR